MPHGHVKRYERNSGFGFIMTDSGEELFVHHSALKEREFLLAGQQVEFAVEPGERGPRAVNVRVTGEVSPKRKNQPDWRGHRGDAPHFEGQEPVLPGKGGKARPKPPRVASSGPIGPPKDNTEQMDDETGTEQVEAE